MLSEDYIEKLNSDRGAAENPTTLFMSAYIIQLSTTDALQDALHVCRKREPRDHRACIIEQL